MTDQLEHDLRAAFDRISAGEPPLGLAEGALRRARRTRSTRWGAVGVAATGLAAAAVLTVGTLAGAPHTSANGTNSAAAQPRVVTAYDCGFRVLARPVGPAIPQFSLLLNHRSGQYRRVPYCDVAPSPDGSRALVHDTDGSDAHLAQTGVLDLATGRVRWIDGYNGAGAWSPDSRRILLTGGPAGLSQQASTEPRNNGFVLMDAADLRPTFFPVPDASNGLGARGVWTPDGQAIAISICACPSGAVHNGPWPVTGIRLYDLRGHQLRTLPATAGLWSEAAFSPDGTAMALTAEDSPRHPSVQIADARTGAVRQSVPLLDDQFIGWYDADHLIVRSGPERGSTTSALRIVDLRGHIVRTVPLRPGDPGEQSVGLSVGSAAGVPDPSHTLTF
jgi:hypothetical protein